MGLWQNLFGTDSPKPKSEPETDLHKKRRDDLRLAALHNLTLPSCNASFPVSDARLDQIQQWIDEKRVWISSLADPDVADAYAGWIDYVEHSLNENREENRTHAHRDEYNEYCRKSDEESLRASELARTIPRPNGR